MVTIHDAVPWTHPETLTRNDVWWHKAMAKRAHRFADAVVVPTHAVAGKLNEVMDFGDRVFHTYSVYARGLESTGGSYYFLDHTALGRQEDWEEPKGRSESLRGNTPDFSS